MTGACFVVAALARCAWMVGEPRLALVAAVIASACGMAVFDDTSAEPLRPAKQGIWKLTESDWDRLVEAVEREARYLTGDRATNASAHARPLGDDGFEELVQDALDDLPEFLRLELERNVVVVVSDDGHDRGAYGLYRGGTVANDAYLHEIVIFRDTLIRDFGADDAELRRQVAITVRHEMAHHLGAYEDHVARLGL